MGAPRDVGEGLIDRDSLNERRKIIEHVDGGIAQPLVVPEMAPDKDQLRAELARPPSRHASADSEVLGFVRCGKYDPVADSNGFAAQRRVEQLFDRGIKGIKVRMKGWWLSFPSRPSSCVTPNMASKNIKRTCQAIVKRKVCGRRQYAE
jgi:hypothetical protein